MTEREAIKTLNNDFTWCVEYCGESCEKCIGEAKKMAIKALQQQIKCANCGYKFHSDSISKLNSCNDCGKNANCKDRPRLGEYSRINCKDWSVKE